MGQRAKATVDQRRKTISCRIPNHVPLVVPGLSAHPGSSSSSHLPLRDQLLTDQLEPQHEVRASGDGISNQSAKTLKPMKNKEYTRNAGDRLRDLPEWLEPFTDNLEDAETLAPAQDSQDSDSGRTTKVTERSRKHNICYSLLKMPSLRRLLENPNHKGPLQKAHW